MPRDPLVAVGNLPAGEELLSKKLAARIGHHAQPSTFTADATDRVVHAVAVRQPPRKLWPAMPMFRSVAPSA